MPKVNNWKDIILERLFPPWCLLCGDHGWNRLDLCKSCYESLPWISTGCRQCGLPVSRKDALICGACLKNPPYFDETVALWHYQTPIQALISTLKFRGKIPIGRLLGRMMANSLRAQEAMPEVIIPVPLHPIRYRQRGFNQAAEIARPIAAILNIPMNMRLCHRALPTQSQTHLNAKARRKNMKKAFQVKGVLKYKHIAIVDDVMTTGTTANELAKTLKQHGAEKVEIWVSARA